MIIQTAQEQCEISDSWGNLLFSPTTEAEFPFCWELQAGSAEGAELGHGAPCLESLPIQRGMSGTSGTASGRNTHPESGVIHCRSPLLANWWKWGFFICFDYLRGGKNPRHNASLISQWDLSLCKKEKKILSTRWWIYLRNHKSIFRYWW